MKGRSCLALMAALMLLVSSVGCTYADRADRSVGQPTTSANITTEASLMQAPASNLSAPASRTTTVLTTAKPETKAPTTTAATTAKPETAAPATTAKPETAAPATTAATTAKPETAAPTTTAATTAKPETATPTTTAATTAKPETAAPTTTASTTAKPETAVPKDDGEEESPINSKRVAFTFDDGPHNTLTVKFVDKLKEYGASATFFVVGNRVGGKAGDAVRYAVENGCEIGIHAYTHEYYFSNCSEERYLKEVSLTDEVIRRYVEGEVELLRPPGGKMTKAQIAASPYSVILWNVDSGDWKYKKNASEEDKAANVQTIVDNVMNNLRAGDIVLMHEIYENSYEAFCIIIDELYKQGYEVVTVSELLGDKLEPGVRYYSGR